MPLAVSRLSDACTHPGGVWHAEGLDRRVIKLKRASVDPEENKGKKRTNGPIRKLFLLGNDRRYPMAFIFLDLPLRPAPDHFGSVAISATLITWY